MKHKHLMDLFIRSNRSDSCINTKFDNRLKSFDCYKFFGQEFSSKLIESDSIDSKLTKKDYYSIIESIEDSNSNEQVQKIIEDNGIGFIKKSLIKKLKEQKEIDAENIDEIINSIENEAG